MEATCDAEDGLNFTAKKSTGGGAPLELTLPRAAVLGDLVAKLAEHEACVQELITIVCKGKVLKQEAEPLLELTHKDSPSAKVVVVYIVRKPPPAADGGQVAAPEPTAPQSAVPQPVAPQPIAAQQGGSPQNGLPSITAANWTGRRVILLLRHGQCCHENETDEMKALTGHGHQQADETSRYIASLFAAGHLPPQRALLHSTSRRARETAAKLPQHLPGLEVWNADILRETDPKQNPMRAEEVFQRLFVAPAAADAADALIVVAHNNIILYLLMRAAGVPIERAAVAWSLFHLRHTSVTRVDVAASGQKQVIAIGAAGHISHASVTWNNITGADMAAWRGGGAERRKFGGRMIVLVRQASSGDEAVRRRQQIEAVASHIKGISEYMVSASLQVACTRGALETAAAVAREFRKRPQILPDSVAQDPELTFQQFFCPPTEHSRDTVVMVAEDLPILYWLLRSLHMTPDEARDMRKAYCISCASLTMLSIRPDRACKVVTVGDTGHLPLECADATFIQPR
jgi:phosphohistidine phosphatase SixA